MKRLITYLRKAFAHLCVDIMPKGYTNENRH